MALADELAFMDATAQAELVRTGQCTPLELVDAAIERIERVNPALNAVITPLYDQARAAAAGPLPDGPFKGVPFLLKDLGATLGGVPQASGSAWLADFVPPHDSTLVQRQKAAGLVIVGKTNAPELGILPTTEPALFGPSRNPWDTSRSTGGSSGGSAAAVAAGLVPFAHANDGGGSIRIPAACCGLVGLKPTRARTPVGPEVGDIIGGLVCEHAVTRTVRDCAALLDATAGPSVGDPYWAPPPARPFSQEIGADPGQLRIAFATRSPNGVPVHPDNIKAVEATAKLLADLGHIVEEASPTIDGNMFTQAFVGVWASGIGWNIDALAYATGKKPTREQFEPLTWGLYEMGRSTNAPTYMLAWTGLQQISRQIGHFLEGYDAWLTPTLVEPPPPLGTFNSPPDNPLFGLFRAAAYVPFTPLANVSGLPAISLPLMWNEQNLPIGVQFYGRFGDEATLLRLAAQLEEGQPWVNRRPPVSA
ncbi:MAG: amidase family protein [Anaerolineae bacterium]